MLCVFHLPQFNIEGELSDTPMSTSLWGTSHVQMKLYKIPHKVSLQISSSAFLLTLSKRAKLCRRKQIAFPPSFAENSTALFHFFPYLKSPVDLQTAPGLHVTHLQSSPAASPPPWPHMLEAAGWSDLWSINQLHLVHRVMEERREAAGEGVPLSIAPSGKKGTLLSCSTILGVLRLHDLHAVSHSMQQQKPRGLKICFVAWYAMIDRKISGLLLECLFLRMFLWIE